GGYVVTLNTGSGADAVSVQATDATSSLVVNGQAGNDRLTGPNATTVWTITGLNQGTVSGVATTFTGVENLTGGSAADNFAFANGAGVTGTVDGGAGTDTIDYSAYTTTVAVNLGTNTPTLTSSLDPDQEVPPHPTSTATGTATIVY